MRKLGVSDLNALWHAGFQLHEQSFLYVNKMNQWSFKVVNWPILLHKETHTAPPSLWLLDQSLSLNLAQFNVVAYVGQLKIFQTFGWHENQIFLNSNFTPDHKETIGFVVELSFLLWQGLWRSKYWYQWVHLLRLLRPGDL